MKGKPAVQVDNAGQLQDLLLTWGRSAPDRLNRTGRKAEVEDWILARWLEHRLNGGKIAFPLRIWRDENPDFYVQMGPDMIGLELTEAVEPAEQVVWTRNAKEDQQDGTRKVRFIDSRWTSGTLYAEMVSLAVSRKQEKCSADCTELLVYLNTTDDMSDKSSTRKQKLGDALADQQRFNRIWVLSGDDLSCFPRSTQLVQKI